MSLKLSHIDYRVGCKITFIRILACSVSILSGFIAFTEFRRNTKDFGHIPNTIGYVLI
jgi:hypothetical protein